MGLRKGIQTLMDKYPTKKKLEQIKNYNILDPVENLIELIRDNWEFADCGGFCLTGKKVLKLQLNTFGWSGNESVIDALHQNLFWTMYWEKSTKGGHYWFRIKL